MPIIGTYNGSIVGEKDLPTGGGGGGGSGANLAYTASASFGVVTSDTGTDATIPAGSTVNASLMLPADKTKLDGIATGATANSTDAQLRDRSTHTGTQDISTVTGLQTALDGKALTVHTHIIGDVTGLQTALNAKQDTLVSGTNIKTINGQSVLGSGDLTISGGGGGSDQTTVTTVSTSGTISASAQTVLINPSTNISLTLPSPSSNNGKMIYFKNMVNYDITFGSPSGTIDGDTNLVMQFANSSLRLISDGTNWNIF